MEENEIIENDAAESSDAVEGDELEGSDNGGSAALTDSAEQLAKEMLSDKPANSAQAKNEKAVNKEIKEQVRKYKLKVDGKDEELTEQELLKRASLGSAAQKRMSEAAELRKNVEQLVDLLRTNPMALLKDPALGIDVKKMFEDYANEQLEEEVKSPEQKEKEQLQKELETLRKQAQKDKEDKEKSEFERLKEKASLDLDNQMTAAMESAGLPQNPYVVKRMADYMMLALQNGKDLSPADIIPIVKKEMYSDFKQFLSVSPDELLEELLTKERLGNLRKRALANSKKPIETANSIKNTTNTSSSEEKEKASSSKKQTIGNWLKS